MSVPKNETRAYKRTLHSAVIRRFISPLPSNDGTYFTKRGVPASWKPRFRSSYPIDGDFARHFTAYITLELDHFDVFKHYDAVRFDQLDMESIKGVGEQLVRWMREIPGVAVTDITSGIDRSSRRCSMGHWAYNYSIGTTDGFFNIWIVRVNDLAATMIAAIDERIDAPAARRLRQWASGGKKSEASSKKLSG